VTRDDGIYAAVSEFVRHVLSDPAVLFLGAVAVGHLLLWLISLVGPVPVYLDRGMGVVDIIGIGNLILRGMLQTLITAQVLVVHLRLLIREIRDRR